MRLPIYAWKSFWMKLGRRVVLRPQPERLRVTSIEALQPRVMLTASTADANISPLLAAALAGVGPATTYSFAGGQLNVSFDSLGRAVAQSVASSDSISSQTPAGPLSGGRTLNGSAPSGQVSSPGQGATDPEATALPVSSALVFQGQDGVDNTLALDLASLPHLADGSSAIKTIVYNGGSGGYNTLDLKGGKFTKETYTATGSDSGILTYDDLKVVFTGLSPVIDTTWAGEYDFVGTTNNDSIHVVDGQDQWGWVYGGPSGGGDLHYGGYGGMWWDDIKTLNIYDDHSNFEQVTVGNKEQIDIATQGDASINLQFTRPATYTEYGYMDFLGVNALSGNLMVDASTLHPSGNLTVSVAGGTINDTTLIASRLTSVTNFNFGTSSYNPFGGPPLFSGQTNEKLIFNDQGATSDYTYNLSATGAIYSSLNGLNFTNQIESVSINGGDGSNTFNVNSLTPGMTLNLTGGNGNDTFNIGNGTSSVVDPASAISIDGGGGTNTLNIFDQSVSETYTYSLTDAAVTRNSTSTATIAYANIQGLMLSTSSGGDTFNVISTAASTSLLTVQGGAGDDTFNLGGTGFGLGELSNLQCSMTIDGGAGTNTLRASNKMI